MTGPATSAAPPHRHFETLASTNATALEMAAAGSGALWITADVQTAGRGRRGRRWVSARGNFAASYLCWPEVELARFAEMSFVTALALRDSLTDVLAPARVTLKWPNDVLVDGKKLSGILLETTSCKGRSALVIGIGVNLAHAPDAASLEEGAVPATSLVAAGGDPMTPEAFLARLRPALAAWSEVWTTKGFAAIRAAWKDHATGLGQPIVARTPARTYHGVFKDLDPTGALILHGGDGNVTLPAAEVYFGAQGGGADASDD